MPPLACRCWMLYPCCCRCDHAVTPVCTAVSPMHPTRCQLASTCRITKHRNAADAHSRSRCCSVVITAGCAATCSAGPARSVAYHPISFLLHLRNLPLHRRHLASHPRPLLFRWLVHGAARSATVCTRRLQHSQPNHSQVLSSLTLLHVTASVAVPPLPLFH